MMYILVLRERKSFIKINLIVKFKIILRLLRLTADLSNEPRKVPHKSFYLR